MSDEPLLRTVMSGAKVRGKSYSKLSITYRIRGLVDYLEYTGLNV